MNFYREAILPRIKWRRYLPRTPKNQEMRLGGEGDFALLRGATEDGIEPATPGFRAWPGIEHFHLRREHIAREKGREEI